MKVVSGGQSGVDRAALDAALELKLPCGGYVPKGRLAEDGPIPYRYPMTESESGDYRVRTELNVVHSDATLILHRGPMFGGTLLTEELCRKNGKTAFAVDLAAGVEPAVERIREFLKRQSPAVLNVAGPRESNSPGIYAASLAVLRKALVSPA